MTVSSWLQVENHEPEFVPLANCTDTEIQDEMCFNSREIRSKNRYIDILAFKHSRVHLVQRASMVIPNGKELLHGYINANFVDGPRGDVDNRKIIACQGPLEESFEDLWRMVA